MNRDEFKDRAEIKDLNDAYAHNSDRRKTAEYLGLYVKEATTQVFMGDPGTFDETRSAEGVPGNGDLRRTVSCAPETTCRWTEGRPRFTRRVATFTAGNSDRLEFVRGRVCAR
jgi:hypothetical protein